MAKKGKLTVRDEAEDSVVPFLRGILTRSLQGSGLSFADAYALADMVRSDLGDDEVTTTELRKAVSKRLSEAGFNTAKEVYGRPARERAMIYVRDNPGNLAPFSKSILGQSLEICAVSRDAHFAVASEVERKVGERGEQTVDSAEITKVTYGVLCKQLGLDAGTRYLRWQEFTNTGRPLILLIGGTTGCGKSTISALLAHRLGIVRTQSTDMLREVMRQIVPPQLLPALHRSSFTAFRALPQWGTEEDERVEPRMLDGYLLQAEEVAVGVNGVFQRAIREQVSLILEGVHMHPGIQKSLAERGGAVIVPVVLATLGKKALRRQLTGRGRRVSARRAERYMEGFDLIWRLQSFLLSEADAHEVDIVSNDDPDESVREIMEAIAVRLALEYSGEPKNVL